MTPATAQAPATSREGANGPVSLGRRRWLSAEVQRWTEAQLISEQQGRAIVSQYPDEAALKRRGVVRGVVTLGVLAGAMVVAACLMLVEHNLARLTRYDKTVAVLGVVAAAFAGSMIGYRRGSQVMGEALALLGTLLFGAGLWALADIYHIQGHYPEVFFWWMVGTMVTATLLKAPMCSAAAVVLSGAWAGTEILGFERGNSLFLVFSGLGFVLAYWQRSLVVLVLSQVGLALWLLATGSVIWRLDNQAVYPLVGLGAAYYAVGLGGGAGRRTPRCWQIVGVAAVLAGLVGPSYWRFHQFHHYWLEPDIGAPMTAMGLALLIVVIGYIGGGWAAVRRDWVVVASAVVSTGALGWWLVTSRVDAAWTQHDPAVAWWLAVGCSVLMAGMGIWLVVRGIAGARAVSFFAGIGYVLLVVILRWLELRGDAVSGAMVLLSAALLLTITAYFWNKQNRASPWAREARHG